MSLFHIAFGTCRFPQNQESLSLALHVCSCPVPGRKHLRSASSSLLIIFATRCSSIGDSTFVAAAAAACNRLPKTSDLPHHLLFSDSGKVALCQARLVLGWVQLPVWEIYLSLTNQPGQLSLAIPPWQAQ